MQVSTRGHGGRRRWMQSTVAVAVLGLAFGACSAKAPDATSAASSTPSATATDTAPPRPTTAEPLPTETAEPLTPTKPTQPAATTSAPDPSATADPGSLSGDCSRTLPAYPVLSPGAQGRAVRALQCFLNDADFGPVTVDGVYGAQTRAAMKRLEATYEGPAPKPGRVDAGVWVLVISRSMGNATLKQGSKGADVTTLQRALRAAGATITVNGAFGAETKKAVQRFQDANRIGADGIVGDETLFLLKSGATIG